MEVASFAGSLRGLLALGVAAALALLPAQSLPQTESLPRLGDAGADELSPGAERRLGEAIMREVRRDAAYLDDAELVDYLNRLAARLTQTSAARGYTFELFGMRDASLNAFALPGGFIGVHTGLVVSAHTESELASVLAHEIGHVTQRHIARMLSEQRQSTLTVLAGLVLAALAARSNPQGAVGIATMAAGAQQQQMLSFSRDAEREADRVGLEMLRNAGYDANAMAAFFGRLQQAARVYESNAPAYMRSHPLTSERIADMQTRLQEGRYRQHADSLDFRLIRAKLGASAVPTVDGLNLARTQFERQIRDKTTTDETAAWFGVAVAALAQRDVAAAERAIAQTRARVEPGHPFVEALAARARLAAGDGAGALAIARAAAGRFVGARALLHLQAEAMLEMKEFDAAVRFLVEQTGLYKTDPALWRMLARAHAGLGQTGLAHRAAAEEYALAGAWLAAIEQLRLAQRGATLDFYSASQVDARLRALQAEYASERKEAQERPGR
ncbi:MAG: M48 family metalloprotease [Burkholderiaceae bacterium]|nr:M48 family metalloprotease [Burkholderiaceae bacterium]